MSLNLLAPTTFTNVLVTDTDFRQLTINNDAPISASLELRSTSGGFVLPRMANARRDLLNPTSGMMIFSATDNTAQIYRNGQWTNVAGEINFEPAVEAASTVNLTAVYDNGTIGVGATLTNNGPLVAFSIDGISPAFGSRILVKNQFLSLENGIYELTEVGSGAVPWILTRAGNYDQAEEIQPGDFVMVNNGATNANTAWVQTENVSAVGVDPILFSQFAPAGVPFIELSGQNELFVGTNTGNTNGGNNRNVAVGIGGVMNSITGANDTVAFGYQAGHDLTVGVNNSLFGSEAGRSLVSANSCVAVGPFALRENTIQDNNIAIGDSALKALNDSIGISNDNTFIGHHCGQSLLDGAGNTIVGASGMSVSTTSNSAVTGLGRLVLNNADNSTDTVAIGSQSAALRAQYSDCTFVGANSDATVSGLTNSGAFGESTTVSLDNAINLGSNCVIGINQPSPVYNLDIANVSNVCSSRLENGNLVAPSSNSGFVTYTFTAQTLNLTDLALSIFSLGTNKSAVLEVMINGATTTLSDFTGGNLVAGVMRGAGNISLVGATYNKIVSTTGDFSISVDIGTQAVVLNATGIAASTYDWTITVKYQIL